MKNRAKAFGAWVRRAASKWRAVLGLIHCGRSWLVTTCLLALANPHFHAYSAESGQDPYVPSGWEMKDSLALNKVKSVVQTRDGYLWLATFDGLGRFDGSTFKLFDKANTPALPSNLIACLFEDHSGALWIGCDSGEVACLVKGRVERVIMPAEWPAVSIDRMLEDRTGTIWILNHAGDVVSVENHLPGKILHRHPKGESGQSGSVALIRDASGAVWTASESTLTEVSNTGSIGRQLNFPVENPSPIVFAGRAGGFWVVDGSWLRRWEDGVWVEDRGHHNWGEILARLPMETTTGDVLIPTVRNGLFIINRQGLERQPVGQAESVNAYAYCICEDREGIIWVGTGSGGLNILRHRAVTMLEPPDHWMGQPVTTAAPKRQGGLFIGTQGAAVYHFDRGLFTGLSRIRDQFNPVVRCLWEDSRNSLWIGTWGAGLWRESQGGYERAGPSNDFPKRISAIFETRSGDLWFGTEEGPAQLQQGQWRFLAREFSISHADTRCLAEGPDGAIWVGLQGGGLGRFADGKWTQFRQTNGLAGDYVWSLLAESDGTVWIGTYGSGLCRFKAGRFSTVSFKNGLPSDVICSIIDDQGGHLWFSSYGGVFRVSKADLTRCANGESTLVDCQVFSMAEGLATSEFAGGCQPSACRTTDGRLWFPCVKGLATIDPGAVRNSLVPPPVVVQELLIDGEPKGSDLLSGHLDPPEQAAYAVGPGHRHVEIRYAGLSFTSPEQMRYRYRMKGLEEQWVEAGSDRSAYYSYLPPGQYLFQVLARNNGGVWSDTGASIRLIAHPYFWQTWWFMGGSVLFGMGGAAFVATSVSRHRELRRREEMERQRASELERTRIARDIHDQLGIGLTRISMLSVTAASPHRPVAQARQHIEEIHKITADLTRSMDEIVWAVNPQHDTLDSLLMYLGEFARKFLETAKIRCRLDLPIDVPRIPFQAEARHHVFLAFQETLNNVVKHAGANEVRIVAKLQDAELILTVTDDGKGFAWANSTGDGGWGNGLKNMESRLHEVGGQFACDSQIGEGTTIRLTLPIYS